MLDLELPDLEPVAAAPVIDEPVSLLAAPADEEAAPPRPCLPRSDRSGRIPRSEELLNWKSFWTLASRKHATAADEALSLP